MASVFRRRITTQIISVLKPFLRLEDNTLVNDYLPSSIKLSQPNFLPPQFELSWKDVVKLKPELQERIHPSTVMTYLKNQEFPTSEGITNIFPDSLNQEKFLFTVDQQLFSSSVLMNIFNRIEKMPLSSCFFRNIPPENVLIEYSSPNIAKPFHLGHFRSTIIGNFMANICEYVGHKVTRINYIGDWGLQYGILAVGFSKFGCGEKLQNDPLTHLFEVYKKANELSESDPSFKEEAKLYFKKMEEGDPEALSLWGKLRDISLKEMNATYKKLNIQFDEIQGEAMYAKDVQDIYEELLKKGLAYRGEGDSIEAFTKSEDGEVKEIVLRKKDGTSLYLSRDLAAAIDRQKKHHFDSLYYVVDSSQTKHFNNLKSILNSMGHSWESELHHIPFGRILKFSTRKGTAVFLHDILDEATERTLENMKNSPTTKVTENMEEVAKSLAIASLIISDCSVRRKRDYPFNWEKTLSMKGNSGVSLQYCHARLNNIKENCGVKFSPDCEFGCLVEPEAIALIQHLAKFEEAVYQSYKDFEPCLLAHYLFCLRNEVGKAIKVLPVKGSSFYVARARLFMFHSAYLVLQKGLQILGITPLNKM